MGDAFSVPLSSLGRKFITYKMNELACLQALYFLFRDLIVERAYENKNR